MADEEITTLWGKEKVDISAIKSKIKTRVNKEKSDIPKKPEPLKEIESLFLKPDASAEDWHKAQSRMAMMVGEYTRNVHTLIHMYTGFVSDIGSILEELAKSTESTCIGLGTSHELLNTRFDKFVDQYNTGMTELYEALSESVLQEQEQTDDEL